MTVASLPVLRRPLVAAALLVVGLGLLTLLVYSNSFNAEFVLDNKIVILRDPRLHAFNVTTLKQIFSENYWWPNFPSDLFRPLTTLSYLFNYAILGNGTNPTGYHLVNFFLHWANAALVLALMRRISGSFSVALIAAIIFAVHPLAVESVTNVVGRADLLATFFVLLGAHFHVRSVLATRRSEKMGWLAGLAVSSTIGVLCKESAIMIIGFVLLYDFLYRWPSLAGTWKQRLFAAFKEFVLRDYIPFVPMLIAFAIARRTIAYESVVQWQYFVDNPIARAEPFQAFMTAMKVQGLYLGLLIFPAALTCDYSYNHIPLYGTGDGAGDLIAWASVLGIIVLLVLAWKFRQQNKPFACGIFLYLGLMFPTANLVKVIGSIMAERFIYLPSVGFALLAALGLDYLGGLLSKILGVSPLSRFLIRGLPVFIVAAGWGYRTYLRNGDWSNERMLWISAVRVAPDSFKTHKGLAEAIVNINPSEAGVDAAIAEAEKGVEILNRPEVDQHIERKDVTLFIDTGRYYGIKAEFCHQRHALADERHFYEKAVAVLLRAVEVDKWVNEESHRGHLARGKKPEDLHAVG